MLVHFFILSVCAAITVVAVRVLVMPGIGFIASALKLSSKTKGQIIGYATSVPELVVVIAAAVSGVFEAGFWNIASSNIINFFLFASAVAVYRQHMSLLNRIFIDEAVFGILSIGIPVIMHIKKIAPGWPVALILLGFFTVYKITDRLLSKTASAAPEDGYSSGNTGKGILLLSVGIITVIIAGRFLGTSAEILINALNTPPWLVGWLLGFITSIPEMASFFEIYRIEKKMGRSHLLHGTQEALDTLIASNMSNLGIILPVGILICLLFG